MVSQAFRASELYIDRNHALNSQSIACTLDINVRILDRRRGSGRDSDLPKCQAQVYNVFEINSQCHGIMCWQIAGAETTCIFIASPDSACPVRDHRHLVLLAIAAYLDIKPGSRRSESFRLEPFPPTSNLSHPSTAMKLHHHHSIAWLAFASAAQAATVIGPTGTLVVSNVKLAPDGIMRR
jgi:hypothetical protein